MRPADLARGGHWQAVGAPFKRRLAWVEHSFPGGKGQESLSLKDLQNLCSAKHWTGQWTWRDSPRV